MQFAAMVDLARTPKDVKEEIAKNAAPVDMPSAAKRSVPTYPYGLCISLDEETLKKLGLEGELPCVGEMVHLCAMAKVTNVSESERETEGGEKSKTCRVELQITHLATESEDAENERSEQRKKRWYGEGDKEEASEAA